MIRFVLGKTVCLLLLFLVVSCMPKQESSTPENYFCKQAVVDSLLITHNTTVGEYEIKLQAFKAEQVLEVFLRSKEFDWTQIRAYPFCAFSGGLGPKIREGDRQIPEGIYQVVVFNPKSKFYLSLGLDYPNARDLEIADPAQPGSDIYIHGGCQTVGCIPISDEQMAELYLFCKGAKAGIQVDILPFRPTEDNRIKYNGAFPQHQRFWERLFMDAEPIL